MVKLFLNELDEPFGLRQEEIECLRMHSCSAGRAYSASVYSISEAVYLAVGASLKAARITAIRFPGKDRITAWPLFNLEQRCAFVLGFRFDSDWRPIAWMAEEVSFLRSTCSFAHLAQTDRAWDWAGYAGLALDRGWLESGPLIFNGRFRTSYPEALLAASEALVIAKTIQQKSSQEQPSQEQQQPGHPNEDFLRRPGAFRFFDR